MMPAGQPASATVVHRDGPSHANSLDGEKKDITRTDNVYLPTLFSTVSI
jgi:hypothetical protein